MGNLTKHIIRVCAVALVMLTVLPAAAQRKKVGVVLSGGGAKGVAHINVLRVIEEAGIPIDYIAGTSMGAIIGGLYSIGYSPQALDSMVRSQDWPALLSDQVPRSAMAFMRKEAQSRYLLTVPLTLDRRFRIPSGILPGQNVYNLFTEMSIGYHDSIPFSTLPIPFACVAYDLASGESVVLDNGSLAQAMRASMSIPGAFEPVRMNGMVLIDGGISNNFPVDVVKEMGAEIIIGVDVSAGKFDADQIRSLMDMFNQITYFVGEEKYVENRKLVDLYIAPDIKPYNSASFNAPDIDSLLVRGERAAREKWDELIALKNKIGVRRDFQARHPAQMQPDSPIHIRRIVFEGLESYKPAAIQRIAGLKEYSVVSASKIQAAVSNLRGAGIFSRVGYRLEGNQPYDIVFTVRESTRNSVSVGLRFDTEEMAAILLNVNLAVWHQGSSNISLTGRLSENPYGRLAWIVGNETSRRLTLSYMFKYNNLDSYYKGDKQANLDFDNHTVNLSYANIHLRNFKVEVGVKYDYFDSRSTLSAGTAANQIKSLGLVDYYVNADYETFDRVAHPRRGSSIKASYTIYTSNFVNNHGEIPYSAAQLSMDKALSVSSRVALLPGIFGRVLIGENIDYPSRNIMGGTVAGRYMPQQIPFVGINYFEVFDNSIIGARLDLRVRLWRKNFVSAKCNFAAYNDDFFEIFSKEGKTLFGYGLGYSYNTFLGPIELLVSYSDWTKKVGAYFSLGYYF